MRRLLLLPLTLALACGDSETDTTTSDNGSTSGATTQAAETTDDPTTGDPPTTDATTSTTTVDPTTDATTGEPTTDAMTTGPTTTTSTTTGDTTTGSAQELPPIDSVDSLEAWLADGSYKTWSVESAVHASTGPHGGNVRTFVNDVALASLAADNAEHPQDAATVKELYGGGFDEIIGYAVSLKTAPESQGGGTWYWYERINDTTYGGDLGVGLCTGCHGGGDDYILTPYPLQ